MARVNGYILGPRSFGAMRRAVNEVRRNPRRERYRRRTPMVRSTGSSEAAGSLHRVWCAEDAPEGSTIQCYLDAPDGPMVPVICEIYPNGGDLNAATPRLKTGRWLWVAYDGSDYLALPAFNSTCADTCPG